MKIEKRKIDELIPATYNPRKDLHPDDPEYQKLKRSIEEFGYVDPIIWNKNTGMVVGGHQRLKVLQELGYEEVDISVVDLSEAQEKALNIALNKIEGDWEEEKLKELLSDLSNVDEELLALTGFDQEEIDDLLEEIDFDMFGNDFGDDEEEEKELNKSDVQVKIAEYNFMVDRTEYENWIEEIRLTVGFDKKTIEAEIKRRFGFND